MGDQQKELINDVLFGEAKEHPLIGLSPNEIDGYLLDEVGVERDEDWYNSNGWDHDFWLIYNKNGQQFCLYGSWWNGDMFFKKET